MARKRRHSRRRARRNPVGFANPRRHRRLRRRARRNPIGFANPRRRHRRRRYGRNPRFASDLGLNVSNLKSIAVTVGGMALVPFTEGFIKKALPKEYTEKGWKIAIQAATAIALGWIAGKTLGREYGRAVFIGAGSYVAVGALKEYFPKVFTGFSGYRAYPTAVMRGYPGGSAGPRALPTMGAYPAIGGGSTVARLDPMNRFSR